MNNRTGNIKKIPVIIDTDIGNDIDDTFALCFALLREELDIRLVTTVLGDPVYSAKIIAQMNERCGKGTIDIGLGKCGARPAMYQRDWVENYDLSSYPGRIYEDGVAQMINVICQSEKTVTILAMGPCTNLAEAIRRSPDISDKVRVIAVFGGLFRGYFSKEPCPEYNVHKDVEAARTFLTGYKNIWISPIDTFFDVVLDRERYQRLAKCRKSSPAVGALLENFGIWCKNFPDWKDKVQDHTPALCDAILVYLAITDEGLVSQTYPIEIEDNGLTRVSETGIPVKVAIAWSDKERMLDFLTDTYCASASGR